MKRYIIKAGITFVMIVILVVTANKSQAIPAFARKYQISCQVCHAPAIPRLKAFGDEFAGNGFRMTEYESPRYFVETGDDRLSLLRDFPLAVRLDGQVTYNLDESEESEFGAPFILKILSGGELSDKLSYYFYFLMIEEGEIVGVEDAFLMYRDLLGTGINVYLGQFQASDPLFKGELRYTLEGYRIYDSKPGSSRAALKYERGIMLEKSFESGTTIIGEVVNGNGLSSFRHLFDDDKYKNFMIRISQDLGDIASVGLFAYTGKEILNDWTEEFTNKILMLGPDLVFNYEDKFVLNLQYVRRRDSRIYDWSNLNELDDCITQGGFAEVIFSPKGDMSKWYLTGLYNWVDSDFDALDYNSATLHAGYLLRRNLRLVTEYTYYFSGLSNGMVNAGFVSAF
jgi:hypothetical protein